MRTEKRIGGKRCFFYENGPAQNILIQPVDDHDLEVLDAEVDKLKDLAPGKPFLLVAFKVSDWNKDLSPWQAPAVFGKEDFGSGAEDTLAYITGQLLPAIQTLYPTSANAKYYVGGYSLAGLFALWAAYRTDLFHGAAGVSPSVWFPGWLSYIAENEIKAQKVYLSLGDREERTRNQTMAQVGTNIRKQYAALQNSAACKASALEWNPGNHFMDPDGRTAKGFAWLLEAATEGE